MRQRYMAMVSIEVGKLNEYQFAVFILKSRKHFQPSKRYISKNIKYQTNEFDFYYDFLYLNTFLMKTQLNEKGFFKNHFTQLLLLGLATHVS